MLKRIIPYLLIASLALFIVACSKKDDEAMTIKKEVSNENVEEQQEIDDSESDEKLGFTTQDVMNLELFQSVDKENLRVYHLDNDVRIETMESSNIGLRFFAYFLKDATHPSAFFLRNTGNSKDLNFEVLDEFYKNYNDKQLEKIDVLKDETDDYHLAGFVFNNELDTIDLPFSLPDITENDFFVKGIDKDLFNQLNDSGNYKELLKLVDNYIEENEVTESDSSNYVLKVLEPIREQLDKVEVHYDDFDNVATIYYKGLNKISAENNLIPFIKTNERYMDLLVGFEKNGWLFADKYAFNIDGEQFSDWDLDFDHDVITGSRIRELYKVGYYEEDLIDAISNGTEMKMRFEGDKGNLDHELSTSEIEAVKVIKSFNEVHHDLSDLIYRFYN